MIRTLVVTKDHQVMTDCPLETIDREQTLWFWADFCEPSDEESKLLETYFHFHPLAIEDCLMFLQRPKLDHYENVHFFVLHALHEHTLKSEEVDLFIGPGFVVTFHQKRLQELDEAWVKTTAMPRFEQYGYVKAAHNVIDKLVDYYFPALHAIEDQLLDYETGPGSHTASKMMSRVFEIRNKLLKLRKTIVPMRDLLYRIISSQRIDGLSHYHIFYADIHDHLLKLSEMLDSNRDMTSDMRDHYMSLSSNRMNTIMKTLTVITTIFMPLTFLAGIYGMNFTNMPELEWHYGYFGVLILMAVLGGGMFIWFKRKGWFE
ncbi:magnesium/cobalt transporter CorA [Paenibacillus spongiae]|uniref:Magnesium transport protein CorA n=1 Tax=Paenibacillus spongiae TaxID=2909671 RepID=A0ABY5SBC4_9BACL|nr:magnesium/cobalt transporter CorA [Paenibacillus spongiae]UVI30818.1 magnesium/cobalt transporter CorA [Paenibacillus spongiae]